MTDREAELSAAYWRRIKADAEWRDRLHRQLSAAQQRIQELTKQLEEARR